jgi:hypothetical protein
VFDGSGFAIKNLRTVKTFVDGDVYYGFFGTLNEVTIKNLTIEDALIVVNLNRFNSFGSFRTQVGALAHTIYNSKLMNIVVQAQIAINNTTTDDINMNRIGGLAGQIYSSRLDQVFVDGFIDAPKSYAGLISGYAQLSTYNRVFTAGKLSGTSFLGGINGDAYKLDVINTYSDVEIMSIIDNPDRLGGLFGSINESRISNSYSNATFVIPQNATYQNSQISEMPFAGLVFNLYNSEIVDSFSVAKLSDNRLVLPIKNLYSSTLIRVFSPYSIGDSLPHSIREKSQIIDGFKSSWDSKLWNFAGELPILKWTPLIRFDEVVTQETSFSFKLLATGAGSTGIFTSIKLYKGNTLVATKPFTRVIEFTDLLYFNTYTIVVEYTVTYSDESSEPLVVTASLDVTTKAKAGTPEISIDAIYPTGSGVIFELTETDAQSLGFIKEVNIYDGNFVLVDTLEDLTERAFYGLESDTNYRIEVLYQYNLNDSLGDLTFSVYGSFRTNPLVVINAVSLWQQAEAIMLDDMVVLDISIDNVDIVQFNRVLINDLWFNVTSATTSRIRVEVNVALFETLGAFTIEVQELEGIHNGIRYNYRLNRNNAIDIIINGEIEVTDVTILDQEGEILEYGILNDAILLEVQFDNPTDYNITSVEVNTNVGNTIISIDPTWMSLDKQSVRIPLIIGSSNNYIIRVVNFKYENENIGEKLKIVENKLDNVFVITDKTIRFIRTVADLQAIQSGYHYQLLNNIDLTGVDWTPINDFFGIIDGNGFSITNLTYQIDAENRDVYFALFRKISGGNIKNLNLHQF